MSKIILLYIILTSSAWAQDEGSLRAIEGRSSDTWTGPSETARDESSTYKAATSDKSPNADTLKLEPGVRPIEAEEFTVRISTKSSTGKVFMIEDPSNNEPRTGKILLLKDGQEEVAAVRVLKNRSGKFIAKLVMQNKALEVGREYRAIKKLGDKVVESIADMRAKNLDTTIRDLELAKEIDPDDAELDRGIPKPVAKSKKPNTSEPDLRKLEISEDDLTDYAVDFGNTDETDLAPYKNTLALQLGLLTNATANGGTTRYTALGLRYGYAAFRRIFFSRPTLQDTLALEAGLFLYKIAGYQLPTDEVDVYSVPVNIRYNLYLNEWFAMIAYAGAVKSFATTTSGSVSGSSEPKVRVPALSRTRLMLGVGGLLKLGPGWALRADAGFDGITFGAVLTF